MAENNKKIKYTEFEELIKRDIEQKGFFYFDKNILGGIKKSDEKGTFIEKLNDSESIRIKGMDYCVRKEQYSKQDIYFIYDSDNFEPVSVKSVHDFLKEVYEYESETINRYFRGERASYQLIPSLFREKEWVENEMELNARVYNDRPGDFADCHSTFDKLVKLKHFVHPSRLLDISTNPLVALFFACGTRKEDRNSVGVVLEAYSRKDEEKFSVSSDTVVMLTAMTNTKLKKRKIDITKNKGTDKKEIDEDGKLLLTCKNETQAGIGYENICPKKNNKSCYYKCWPNKNEENAKKTTERPKLNDVLVKDSWAQKYIGELCHQCKKEGMSIYWDDVCFNELNQCILIHPPLNNDRIVRQHGCFIMCGMNPGNIYEPPESLYKFFRYPNDEASGGTKRKKAKFYYILPGDDKELSQINLMV